MKTKQTSKWMLVIAVAAVVTSSSCKKDQLSSGGATAADNTSLPDMMSEKGTNPDDIMLSSAQTESAGGYVYTESNEAAGNRILVYKQGEDGMLYYQTSVASGGAGNDKGLGSQGAVILDAQHQYLYAVNAGANSISSFWVHSDGSLTLAHTVSSEGTTPISVTAYNDLLYVVNSGSDDIAGFSISSNGALSYIAGSRQSLSATDSGPAEIKFQPTGHVVFVTEKNTNKIAMFPIGASGAAGLATFAVSVGVTPFGFDFARENNFMVVSNAAGGAEDAGSLTSYSTYAGGIVTDMNGAVPDHQSAPCWVAPTHHGRYVYTTNTAGNTISAYYVSQAGKLYLVPFAQVDAGAGPIDIVVSADNRYVYSLNSVARTIGEYKRKVLGTIIPIGDVMDMPSSATGLACF